MIRAAKTARIRDGALGCESLCGEAIKELYEHMLANMFEHLFTNMFTITVRRYRVTT